MIFALILPLKNVQQNWAIGVDIGGTHISCAAANLATGELMNTSFARHSYDNQAPAAHILQAWADALRHTMGKIPEAHLLGIGFAMPGPFDYRSGISNMTHKFPHLNSMHLPSSLEAYLPESKSLPMRFINDASAFAVGEAWAGEGKGAVRIVCITLGTGFGSAFAESGVPVVTREDVPPEGCLWHLPFHEGIADEYFSTRWFTAAYEKLSGIKLAGVKELMEMAENDRSVRHLFEQFGQNLAECLGPWLLRFQADKLVVGGNISNALPLFGPVLTENLRSGGCSTQVVASRLKESAALIGAARLLDDGFWARVFPELPKI
jgi:glucokinase